MPLPSIYRLPEPEFLAQNLVLEPIVRTELEVNLKTARGRVDLEARDVYSLETFGEDIGVRGLEEVIDFGR
jgi:hypothetical protein